MADTLSFPEPPDVIRQKPSLRKYLRYLLFFGPGAILASMTIGQGQLILGPQIGAWAGYALLWLITLNIGSYVIAYIGTRFSMLSGISIMDMFALKTRGGWLNWLIIPLAVLGLVFGILARRSSGIAAILLCSAAIIIGIFRLAIGGGII